MSLLLPSAVRRKNAQTMRRAIILSKRLSKKQPGWDFPLNFKTIQIPELKTDKCIKNAGEGSSSHSLSRQQRKQLKGKNTKPKKKEKNIYRVPLTLLY